MSDWILLEEEKPESGKQVKIKNDKGEEILAYRGSHPCSRCWYSPFGGELIFSPTHWKEISDDDKVDTSGKSMDFMSLFERQ